MKKFTFKLITFVIGIFFVVNLTAQTKIPTINIFKIQVGLYYNPSLGNFDTLKKFGSLYIEKAEKGKSKILLGDYKTEKEARQIVASIKKIGFKDAYLIKQTIPLPTNTTKLPPLKNPETSPKIITNKQKIITLPTDTTSESNKPNLMVQLTAVKKIDMTKIGKVSDLGQMYSENEKGMIKISIGMFKTEKEATEILNKAKERGFDKAFIKTLPPSKQK